MIGQTPKSVVRQGNLADLPRLRRPFWLPASSYYVLAAAAAIAFFFLVWGILHDGGDQMPWVPAGIGASTVLMAAVILREVILRRARNRVMVLERNFDRQLNQVYSRLGTERNSGKLTIERNEELLREIRNKSEAAKVLKKFAAGHREVFELCDNYLARNENELRLIGVGSPRLSSLRKGKESVGRYHRFHVLQWAEIEARRLTLEAKDRARITEKVEAAQKAINVIDAALGYYPDEHSLIESREVLDELLASIRVTNLVEKAELAAFRGQYPRARSLYRDALFYLGRNNVSSESGEAAADRIHAELEKLRELEGGEP